MATTSGENESKRLGNKHGVILCMNVHGIKFVEVVFTAITSDKNNHLEKSLKGTFTVSAFAKHDF